MNLSVPLNEKHIVLHSCCAPCSAAVITRLLEEKIKPTVIFYNPNIHPKDEYERRKAEQIRFAQKKGVRFVDCDYDTQYWFEE
ncbi:MAG TPA: epoxyqueuosine reductase QueH, partial [Candidatus Omnitrophota bacterium]|nr:epoxyqueuosine reductase QueH [Candidatus Omnitrophota bacterium]